MNPLSTSVCPHFRLHQWPLSTKLCLKVRFFIIKCPPPQKKTIVWGEPMGQFWLLRRHKKCLSLHWNSVGRPRLQHLLRYFTNTQQMSHGTRRGCTSNPLESDMCCVSANNAPCVIPCFLIYHINMLMFINFVLQFGYKCISEMLCWNMIYRPIYVTNRM